MKIVSSSSADLSALREKFASNSVFGFDVEASSRHAVPKAALDHDKLFIVGYGIAFPDGDKTYVPIAHSVGDNAPKDEAVQLLSEVLSDESNTVWIHNLKYEHQAVHTLGIEIRAQALDSMLAQFLLGKSLPGTGGLKLKAAVREYLGHQMITWDDVMVGNSRADMVDPGVMGPYCADDSLQTLRLGEYWEPQLEELGLTNVFRNLECPFTAVLAHMREAGFVLDAELLTKLHTQLSEEAEEYAEEFFDLVGVPIGSNKRVSKRLFKELKWWPTMNLKEGKGGEYSIDAATREKLAAVLDIDSDGMRALEIKNKYAKIAILISTFTSSLVDLAKKSLDGKLRCEFNQAVTATGRLSSSKPNFQNIPRPGSQGEIIRKAFLEEEGWILCASDYSQADLVMMAHLSQDALLMKAYNENLDLHAQTAEVCDCDRKTGKVINLSVIYEATAVSVARTLKISKTRAEILLTRWHASYPGVRAYHERMHQYARTHGYVKTITGRIRYIPNIHSKNWGLKSGAEREASNTPDQGSVADVMKIAMRNLFNEWREKDVLYNYWTKKGKARILSQVHDEIICGLREDFAIEGAADIKRHMETAVKLRVPMKADPGYGITWLGSKPKKCPSCKDERRTLIFDGPKLRKQCVCGLIEDLD